MDSDTDFCRHYLRQDAATRGHSSSSASSTTDNQKVRVRHVRKVAVRNGVTPITLSLSQRYRSLFVSITPTVATNLLRAVVPPSGPASFATSHTWKSDVTTLPDSARHVLTKIDAAFDFVKLFVETEVGVDCSQQQTVGTTTPSDFNVGSREGALLIDCFGIPADAFQIPIEITENTIENDAMDTSLALKSIAASFDTNELRHFQRHYFPSRTQFTAILAHSANEGAVARIREKQVKRWLPEGVPFPLFRWFVGCLFVSTFYGRPDAESPVLFDEEGVSYPSDHRPLQPPSTSDLLASLQGCVAQLEHMQATHEDDLLHRASSLLYSTQNNLPLELAEMTATCVNLGILPILVKCATVSSDVLMTNTPEAISELLSLGSMLRSATVAREGARCNGGGEGGCEDLLITPMPSMRDSNYIHGM